MAKKERVGKGRNKCWFWAAITLIIIAFFLALDFLTTGGIGWSLWPVGAILFFEIAYLFFKKFGGNNVQ